jgi:hypothetical protein
MGLQGLATTLSAWRAKDPASSLDRLNEALSAYDNLTVAELCAILDRAQGGDVEPKRPKRSAINDTIVQTYLSDLREAENDAGAFDQILVRLKGDRKARLPEARQVANAFVGLESAYKTKAEAIQAIKRKQSSAASLHQRLERSSGIF